MDVFVALRALARHTQEGPLQILHLDAVALDFGDGRRVVALRAFQRRVLALERVTCGRVMEPARRWIPLNEVEIFTVVLGVTNASPANRPRSLTAYFPVDSGRSGC